jgi:hypothetical protein
MTDVSAVVVEFLADLGVDSTGEGGSVAEIGDGWSVDVGISARRLRLSITRAAPEVVADHFLSFLERLDLRTNVDIPMAIGLSGNQLVVSATIQSDDVTKSELADVMRAVMVCGQELAEFLEK